MATIAIPVSRTSVFEKKDTSTPVTKPVVTGQILITSIHPSSPSPARLPPDNCRITSGFNHSLDSSTAREAVGEVDLDTDAGTASRRMGCWRPARKMPVDTLRVSGMAWRRSAPRQSAIDVIISIEVSIYLNARISLLTVSTETRDH